MKKITIILVFILIAITMQSCQHFFYYFINKYDNREYYHLSYDKNNENNIDTLIVIRANTMNITSSSLDLYCNNIDLSFKFYKSDKIKVNIKDTNLTLKYNQKIVNLGRVNKYYDIREQKNKYFFDDNGIADINYQLLGAYDKDYNNLETKCKTISFSFEPGLKEGDTLTLFTNGILTYENGTKILPDSINIIVPD